MKNVKDKKTIKYFLRILALLIAASLISAPSASAAKKLPPWAAQRKIAHAGGGIGGSRYTNSLDALTLSLSKRCKTIELDFEWTSDHVLVCYHKRTGHPVNLPLAEQFLEDKIKGMYTRMTAEKALNLMAERSYTYLVIDTKDSYPAGVYQEIVRILSSSGKRQYINNIIPQIYNKNQYKQFKNVHDFRYGIFTLYKLKSLGKKRIKSIAKFAKKRKLAVTIKHSSLTKTRAKILRKSKVLFAVHTINSRKAWKRCRKKGASIVYTDTLL